MFKNVASQKIAVYAWDNANGVPKTGDAANISAQISIDGAATAATNDVAPTELDATDAKGIYIFDMTQAETNGDLIILSAVSATADIDLQPVILYTVTPMRGTDSAAQAGDPMDLVADAVDGTSVAVNGLNGKGDWNIGKSGYALTTADWNVGKTGYSLTTADWNVGKTGYSLTTADWNVGKSGYALTPVTGLGDQTADITGDLSGSVGSVAGNVDGNVADVANLSNLPTIPTNWITAAGINAGAMDDKGNWNVGKSGYALILADWNVGKTGYALTIQDWNLGKTGYSLAVTPPTAVEVRTEIDSNSTKLATLVGGIIEGTTTGTPTTTSTNTDLTGFADSELVGRVIVFIGGTADGQAAEILTYTSIDGIVTFAALTTAAAAADDFKIV